MQLAFRTTVANTIGGSTAANDITIVKVTAASRRATATGVQVEFTVATGNANNALSSLKAQITSGGFATTLQAEAAKQGVAITPTVAFVRGSVTNDQQDTNDQQGSDEQESGSLMVIIVCILVAVVVCIIAIIGGVCWYRRSRQHDPKLAHSDLPTVKSTKVDTNHSKKFDPPSENGTPTLDPTSVELDILSQEHVHSSLEVGVGCSMPAYDDVSTPASTKAGVSPATSDLTSLELDMPSQEHGPLGVGVGASTLVSGSGDIPQDDLQGDAEPADVTVSEHYDDLTECDNNISSHIPVAVAYVEENGSGQDNDAGLCSTVLQAEGSSERCDFEDNRPLANAVEADPLVDAAEAGLFVDTVLFPSGSADPLVFAAETALYPPTSGSEDPLADAVQAATHPPSSDPTDPLADAADTSIADFTEPVVATQI